MHGGRVQPLIRHHRPPSHENEDDIVVERGCGHWEDFDVPRVHFHGSMQVLFSTIVVG